MPAERIREAKRTIDRHNQWRNDVIEAMDAALLPLLPPPGPEAPLVSETPGMMLDRLSILALREYHLEELILECGSPLPLLECDEGSGSGAGGVLDPGKCEEQDGGSPPALRLTQSGRGLPQSKRGAVAEGALRAALEEKLRFVKTQREVLTACLEEVLTAPEGRRFFPFRACKLYNELATNPAVLQCCGEPSGGRHHFLRNRGIQDDADGPEGRGGRSPNGAFQLNPAGQP